MDPYIFKIYFNGVCTCFYQDGSNAQEYKLPNVYYATAYTLVPRSFKKSLNKNLWYAITVG